MKGLLRIINERLMNNQRLCLATVVRRYGSAPREVGAKCLIGEEGILWGSVGGGSLEASVMREARGVTEGAVPMLLRFRLDNKDVAKEGMICGGNVDIFLEPILPNHAKLWRKVEEAVELSHTGLKLITAMEPERWSKGLPSKWLAGRGKILEGDEEATIIQILEHEPRIWEVASLFVLEGTRSGDLLVESLLRPNRLVIFGAGHIGRYVAHMGAMLDFDVLVYDDSPEFLDPSQFPPNARLLLGSFQEALSALELDEKDFVVIATRGHINDRVVLEQVLKREPYYVGMIGSQRKRDMIFQYLKEKGVGEERLKKVHSPIGLAIGAKTPQEIAVSIMAEIIKTRSGALA